MRFPYSLLTYAFITSGEKVLPLVLKSVSYTAFAKSIILVILGVGTINFSPTYSIGTSPFGTSSNIYRLSKDGGASISLYA